jgi:Phosphoesterase family
LLKKSIIHRKKTINGLLILAGLTAVLARTSPPTFAEKVVPMTVRGYVAGTYFTPPAGSVASVTTASYFSKAKVCADLNNNAVCDAGEASTTTDSRGRFVLHSLKPGPVIVEISTDSSNGGHVVPERMVFRAALGQIEETTANAGHAAVPTPLSSDTVVTPLTTEIVRMMEDDNIDYQTAKWHLAVRLGVAVDQIVADPNTVTGLFSSALLTESVILSDRFALAARMVDRGDVSPAVLAKDPNASGPAITMPEAQQVSMNLEGIPRYDHIFIIVLENKATSSIKNSAFAPKINAYLTSGNQFTSYYATGNPSEPNYTAMAAADDFGITDDSAWNCVPTGDTADLPDDPLPTGLSPCTNATNHNIKNRANLFNGMTSMGMTWRIYNESTNPGRDVRLNGVADATLIAADHVYPAGSPVGAIGNASLLLPFPSGLYATKHNPPMPFQNVRSAPEFFSSNRTMGGGQWDDAIKSSPATPAVWDVDQLGTDLATNDLANLNFLVPDQCDDMHGITVRGTISGTTTVGTASDCSGSANIYRGDLYVGYLIDKIQASAVWKNTQQRTAIVIMFDEGTSTTGFNSCCGWNQSPNSSTAGKSLGVLSKAADGTVTVDTAIARYNQGNKGHGPSIFGVLTNQPNAPRGVVDSDAYSHISFVRTLQDMFELADPGNDWSYMNRSRYTEKFIAANLLNLPEYSGVRDQHFDAVRPMNHAFVIPAGYVQKNGFPTPQLGPDANQFNAWALK